MDRFFFQDIRPVDELREEMAATKAAAAEVKPGGYLPRGSTPQAQRAPSLRWRKAPRSPTTCSTHRTIGTRPLWKPRPLTSTAATTTISRAAYSDEQWKEWTQEHRLRNMGSQAAKALLASRPKLSA